MTVTPASPHHLENEGKPYYFCSVGCKGKFSGDPAMYLQGAGTAGHPAVPASETEVGSGVIYTCPMHPEIRLDHPGSCPICGMSLEPLMPTLDDDDNPELADFSRRFWWTLPLTAIVTSLAMFG
ncbi:heavy metal-binding domain-containing protein, partial [Thermomonas sp.]|uniref:heavy metal-binding domain-containing protein n=1 Tax=Thermomonas sp. TaxID=1971895 RepID=UPI002488347A